VSLIMREKLSNFIDGELNQTDSEQLIKQMQRDEDLRSLWGRLNIYSAAMRDELSPALNDNFSNHVIEALRNEPVQLSPAVLPEKKSKKGPLVGFAIAASLLGIAILLQKPLLQGETENTGSNIVALTVAVDPDKSVETEKYELIVANSKNENVRERINRLLVEHNEYNPASDMTGMWSYSRFVGYNPSADSNK